MTRVQPPLLHGNMIAITYLNSLHDCSILLVVQDANPSSNTPTNSCTWCSFSSFLSVWYPGCRCDLRLRLALREDQGGKAGVNEIHDHQQLGFGLVITKGKVLGFIVSGFNAEGQSQYQSGLRSTENSSTTPPVQDPSYI